jgi:hypothetical protein
LCHSANARWFVFVLKLLITLGTDVCRFEGCIVCCTLCFLSVVTDLENLSSVYDCHHLSISFGSDCLFTYHHCSKIFHCLRNHVVKAWDLSGRKCHVNTICVLCSILHVFLFSSTANCSCNIWAIIVPCNWYRCLHLIHSQYDWGVWIVFLYCSLART